MEAVSDSPRPPTDLSGASALDLPGLLADHHRITEPGDQLSLVLPDVSPLARVHLSDVLTGAGFSGAPDAAPSLSVLTRQWTLPDTVGPAMRMLVCGLNPSPAAADAGVGFARPGNRFWPAALAAGLVTVDRDPDHALAHHGIGMTDMVKRTTRRADELTDDEYDEGLGRLTRLVTVFRPSVVCFVGLAGWRTVIDRRAQTGWQDDGVVGAPTYLMPSTSGLNASSRLEDFVDHLTEASRPVARC